MSKFLRKLSGKSSNTNESNESSSNENSSKEKSSNESLSKKNMEYLKNVQYKDIKFFTLNGYKNWAKVVKVYDGDTITIVCFVDDKPIKFRCRLSGIDTPEKRASGKYIPSEREVRASLEARNRLMSLISDKLVYIVCNGTGKYGRSLIDIYKNEEMTKCYNKILIEEGHACEYTGGKKLKFEDWYQRDI